MDRLDNFVRRLLLTPALERTVVINFVLCIYRRVKKKDKHFDVGNFLTSICVFGVSRVWCVCVWCVGIYIYIYIYIPRRIVADGTHQTPRSHH